jgi:hypothetical protein
VGVGLLAGLFASSAGCSGMCSFGCASRARICYVALARLLQLLVLMCLQLQCSDVLYVVALCVRWLFAAFWCASASDQSLDIVCGS